ncbi:MAG: DUF87 domain-containing protein [Sedimenticola sp.]
MMKNPTLQSDLFTPAQRKQLASLGFFDLQHLADYTAMSNGAERLGALLGLEPSVLHQRLTPFLEVRRKTSFQAQPPRISFGLVTSAIDEAPRQIYLDDWPLDIETPERGSVKDLSTAQGVRDQGDRGTCVAHAHSVALSVLHGGRHDFSPQFLYNRMKKIEGNESSGSHCAIALQALNEFGCCLEKQMPYNPVQQDDSECQHPPTRLGKLSARRFRTNSGRLTYERNLCLPVIEAMISGSLGHKPRALPIGLPLFESFYNAYTWDSGFINLPVLDEKISGHHEMLVVSYVRDDHYPGGGYLVILNSWGERWAANSPEGPGICRLPYAYVTEHALELSVPLLANEHLDIRGSDIPQRQRSAASPSLLPIAKPPQPSRSILLGRKRNGETFHWTPEVLANEHLVIVGASGEGKSNAAKSIITRAIEADTHCTHVIHDIHGEYSDLADSTREGVSVDITATGIPFPLLHANSDQPMDIQAEYLLDDIRTSNPQIGNIQADTLRKVLTRGLAGRWCNEQLRQQLEAVDDASLQAQIRPFLLLLRSKGFKLDKLLRRPLVTFDLSSFQDKRSRAAFVILTNSRLYQYQRTRQGKEKRLRIWIEEATTVRNAESQLTTLFQEGRKFGLSTVYITQLLNDTPPFVSRNCATQIYFHTAVADHPQLRHGDLPPEPGTALVHSGEKAVLVRFPLYTPDKRKTHKHRLKLITKTGDDRQPDPDVVIEEAQVKCAKRSTNEKSDTIAKSDILPFKINILVASLVLFSLGIFWAAWGLAHFGDNNHAVDARQQSPVETAETGKTPPKSKLTAVKPQSPPPHSSSGATQPSEKQPHKVDHSRSKESERLHTGKRHPPRSEPNGLTGNEGQHAAETGQTTDSPKKHAIKRSWLELM